MKSRDYNLGTDRSRRRLGWVATCLVGVVVLAGCPTAVQPPPAVSFTTEEPMIEIPALMEGVAMSSVTLPAALGGSGELTYSLTPEVPGLTFTAATRVLDGTPTAAGSYSMTYTATDTRDIAASLRFTITVQAAPPPLTTDPAPTADTVASGAYLSAVLGGDANDALTLDGAAALAEDVLTDDQVAALLAADWWKTPAELAAANPAAYAALLAAVVPAYDKHLAPATHTVTLRENVMPVPDHRFLPPIDLTTFTLGAAHVAALSSQPPVERTESCYLSVGEATTLLGSGDPALTQRAASCIVFSDSGLSTMQAVEVARTCAGGGCSGEAGRQVLTAIAATVVHGMIDSMTSQVTDMVIAEWLMGSYVGSHWVDDDRDAIGELRGYVVMHILEDRAGFFLENENGEVEVDTELGPWIHRRRSGGGEFASADERLHYRYIVDHLHVLIGGAPDHDLWMRRIGHELGGTWSGRSDDDTYTLEIDERGVVVLTVSGEVKRGWMERHRHHRDDDRDNFVLDNRGFPVPSGCGALVMLFPDSDEAQEWRFCLDDDDTMIMHAQAPPYDPDEEWDLNLELTRH